MANAKNPDAALPFSIRLTAAEKAVIKTRAGSTPLGVYIRNTLLDSTKGVRRISRRRVTSDVAHLAQVLGLLGQTRLGSSLAQLAAAADNGSLPLSAETESALMRAFADVATMRGLLMQALGVRADDEPIVSLSASFLEPAAGGTP